MSSLTIPSRLTATMSLYLSSLCGGILVDLPIYWRFILACWSVVSSPVRRMAAVSRIYSEQSRAVADRRAAMLTSRPSLPLDYCYPAAIAVPVAVPCLTESDMVKPVKASKSRKTAAKKASKPVRKPVQVKVAANKPVQVAPGDVPPTTCVGHGMVNGYRYETYKVAGEYVHVYPELMKKSYRELQTACKAAGLKANGKREELVARLIAHKDT